MSSPLARTRVAIVDDEPLGRERIRSLLAGRNGVTVAAEAANGDEAVTLLAFTPLDLVFLDIQMPGKNGFEVIRAVGPDRMPPVVFVTAYDRFALDAFAVHALDYLVKPFDAARFHEALDHALAHSLVRPAEPADGRTTADKHQAGKGPSGAGSTDDRLQRLLDAMEDRPRPAERLLVKERGGAVFIRTTDVDWMEATGNYVTLHVGDRRHLLRTTMAALEDRLDGERFLRIHRSTIVNMDRVKDLTATFNGDYELRLTDGTRLTLSRGYRHVLDRFG